MPPRPVLALLSLLAVVPPFAAQAAGTMFGSFAMFTRIERYHLELAIRTAHGRESVPVRSLAPHLSRDQKRMILPAAGYAPGADQIELVDGGLEDLAAFLCALHPRARSGEAVLQRARASERAPSTRRVEVPCSGPR